MSLVLELADPVLFFQGALAAVVVAILALVSAVVVIRQLSAGNAAMVHSQAKARFRELDGNSESADASLDDMVDAANRRRKFLRRSLTQDAIKSMGHVDYVVIGSGVGGLTTAALLSRSGFKVAVLEQHTKPGGCTHVWRKAGAEFDTGLHYLGGRLWDKRSPPRRLFDAVTSDRVEWTHNERFDDVYAIPVGSRSAQESKPAEPVARMTGGKAGFQALAESLKRDFPGRERAAEIEKFISELKKSTKAGRALFGRHLLPRWLAGLVGRALCGSQKEAEAIAGRTVSEVVTSITKDRRLQLAMTYIAGDHGVAPERGSFFIHSSVIQHYRHGSTYPVGGSERIAEGAIGTIEAAGGMVFVRSPVDKLIFEGTPLRCVGVQSGKIRLFPKHGIFSGAGALTTHARLVASEDYALLREQYPAWKMAGDILGVAPAGDKDFGPARTPAETEGPQVLPPPYEDASKSKKMSRPVYNPSKAAIKLSTSHVYLFVGFRGSQAELKLPTTNSWVFNGLPAGWDSKPKAGQEGLTPIDLPARTFHGPGNADLSQPPIGCFVSFPSAKDPTYFHRMKGEMERKARDIARFADQSKAEGEKKTSEDLKGASAGGAADAAAPESKASEEGQSAGASDGPVPMSTAIVVAEAPWSAFLKWHDSRVKKRGEEYEQKKTLLQEHLLSAVFAVRPDLRERVEYVCMASPASNVHYLHAPHGASYGLDHDVARFTECRTSLHPDTGVPGLYLTGQDVCSVGVAGAAMGGLFAACAASPWTLVTHADILM